MEEYNKPPHRGLKKGLYLIPSAFTAANIAMGFLAVLSSVRGFQVIFDESRTSGDLFRLCRQRHCVGDFV